MAEVKFLKQTSTGTGQTPTTDTTQLAGLGIGVASGTSNTIKLANASPAVVGEIGMNTTTGRPRAFVGGVVRELAHTDELIGQLVYTVSGTLVVGVDLAFHLRPSSSFTITEVFVEVLTAPTGASLIVDVNKNGTTIFTTQANRPTITASTTTATSEAPDVTSLAKNDNVTIDVDQIGSTVAGANLTVHVRGRIT